MHSLTHNPATVTETTRQDAKYQPQGKAKPGIVTDLVGLANTLVRLINKVDEQAERERRAYESGWHEAAQIMYENGYQVGYARAHEEMDAAWNATARSVVRAATSPSHEELEQLRYPHHTPEQLANLRRAARERFGLPMPTRTEAA